ncbi:MAG: glycosyltransferase family 4 protein [Bryobacteraceae bacterium]
MRLAFVTSTPLDVVRGSGTFHGIATLARALEALGCQVQLVTPSLRWPVYTLERLWFNERLRWRDFRGFDAVVGFDMDGYRLAGGFGGLHVASIKGVIADEMRFERGATRATMGIQAACERRHVRRASLVTTTSHYAAGRLQELYGLSEKPRIVPEAIDLAGWRERFQRNPAAPDPSQFTVLSVCRFYPRKRLELLLEAAQRLRGRIPELQVRIVGGGPEAGRLRRLWREKRLEKTVRWLGDVSPEALAREYQCCDVFALPSVQEGFGIVFLEAMAAGKPIVAARAGAAPEVVAQGLLAEPEDAEALTEAIARLHQDRALCDSLAQRGLRVVGQFDAPKVAQAFLAELSAYDPDRKFRFDARQDAP